ncbi:MAG: glycosyltransferase family 1 protein [Bacteroidales bacterium]|nr:glycosyltransferase family 1 protein [Bacteroidales bacterium]MCF8343553.1 glycosyltransferase family 1 protein [Bacteroidales bacterium]MCF8351397.1 glycosyltransferase family 1 protein [Bacteroidales bacterium]MCF8375604.1 glycosyltransferase family 1 protein [Bacteroidales bacterium]
MREVHLHIVSFDIPYPPNYGGVIDVFYKLKALSSQGVKIHLHCFEYPGRKRSDELNKYCETVDYYNRRTGYRFALSTKPYIVSGRRSSRLLENLKKDQYPILFEGLHSCFYIDHPELKNRLKIYRESNIEHRYYFNLFKVENKLYDKLYYIIESLKLRLYQKVLWHADIMLAVSKADTIYLQSHFKNKKVIHLPSFHANEEITIEAGKGRYALYHGNIEVPENARAAEYLIREVFQDLDMPLIIAGMKPPQKIRRLVAQSEGVELISDPDDKQMFELIRHAHINVLVTFQATGLKLKLLNTLYNGRFCLVNDKMLSGTFLDDICQKANETEGLKARVNEIAQQVFDEGRINERMQKLNGLYCNKQNAEQLIRLIS